MRKLKDALRLKLDGGQSHQQIASALGISKGVVAYFSPSWTAFQADRGRDFSVIVDGISG